MNEYIIRVANPNKNKVFAIAADTPAEAKARFAADYPHLKSKILTVHKA